MNNMPALGVNIDHIATLRQARKGSWPDPLEAALICEEAGADSIVAHLREDRRHIREEDLLRLKKCIRKRLNLEMSLAKDIVGFACRLRPDQATLVPEKRAELTTEGGLDVLCNFKKIEKVSRQLFACGVEVSLFIDPDKKQVEAAFDCGVKIIEIHTGCLAQAKTARQKQKSISTIIVASERALERGMLVNAGHGLDYGNVAVIAALEGINELNIGYSIVCRALFVGLKKAVREMKGLIRCSSAQG